MSKRPEAQVSSRYLYEGSRPAIYGLTRKGATLLREHGLDVRRRLLDGIDKEHGAGWRFIEHTVSIAEFMVRLELAADSRADLRILERADILEDAPKSNRDRLVKLEASIRIRGALRKNAVVPDALFGLRFNNRDSYFMLEVDRERCRSSDTRVHSTHIFQRKCRHTMRRTGNNGMCTISDWNTFVS